MLFSSTEFIFIFLPAVIISYYLIFFSVPALQLVCGLFSRTKKGTADQKLWEYGNKISRVCQNILLLAASLFFYAYGEPSFVFVMIGSIMANWLFALIVDKVRENKAASKTVLTVMLVANFSVMFIYKYLMFTIRTINSISDRDFFVPSIVLPIGISFFTFQAVSYVIDVYRKNGDVQKNPMNVGLYVAFFPQLIAGPIVRYETIAEQIKNRKETIDDFSAGVCRFIIGFGKKVLIANTMAVVAEQAFKSTNELTVAFAWLGIISYALQIYFDFSGYSDMAIGMGKMFGFHFLENFDYPYISKSISEFWRRWHISLGTWFRDYVYFPLGGSRVSNKRLIWNLFIVWSLTGLWHGANFTFLLWGLLYFAFIMLEKLFGFEQKFNRLTFLKHIYVILVVILGWVLFRSDSVSYAGSYIKSMFGFNGNSFIDDKAMMFFWEYKHFYIMGILFATPLAKWFRQKFFRYKIVKILYPVTLMLVFIVAISFIAKGMYNPFIYFNF